MKRKISYESEDEEDEHEEDEEMSKKARMVPDDSERLDTNVEPSVRRSVRSGKGSGGRLTQMKELERMQTQRLKRPSTIDIATQDEEVNPMAPSSQVVSRSSSRKGRITTNEDTVAPQALGRPAPASSTLQPQFMFAEPGQPFGFKLPSHTVENGAQVPTRTRTRFVGVSSSNGSVPRTETYTQAPTRTQRFPGTTSQSTSQGSVPSSYTVSLFSGGSSGGASTAPTSRAASVCSSSGQQRRAQQHSLPSSQHASSPSFDSAPTSFRSATTLRTRVLDNTVSQRDHAIAPTRSAVTDSFYNLPLNANRTSLSLSAAPGLYDTGDSQREIDEISPSEDERNAEETLRRDSRTLPSPDDEDDAMLSTSQDDIARVSRSSDVNRNADDTAVRYRQATARLPDNRTPRQRPVATQHRGDRVLAVDDGTSVNGATTQHRQRLFSTTSGDRNPGQPPEVIVTVPEQRPVATQHRRDRVPAVDDGTSVSGATMQHRQRQSSTTSDRDPGQPPEDIVTVHRQRNRAPRLPSNTQLLAARNRQASSTSSVAGETPHNGDGEPPVVSQMNHSARAGSDRAEPWQLQFYDPPTRDVIDRAKQFSHCDAASIDAFPARPSFNTKAIEYIDEAIAERQSRGLIVSDGWWPQHASSITRLLWEDLGSWRSAMRKKARTFVTQRYEWDPENRRERNIDIAKHLLGNGGLFLRDGTDEEGHVNNLAHSALSGLVIDFFYTSSSSVGKLFPEVFAQEVPRATVALAATALKVVLDEIASGRGEVNFRVNIYLPVYAEILGLMNKCDTNVIHRDKTKALRTRWAQLGSNGMPNEELSVAGCNFDVDLH